MVRKNIVKKCHSIDCKQGVLPRILILPVANPIIFVKIPC